MMLISHERLDQLKEQLDYLTKMKESMIRHYKKAIEDKSDQMVIGMDDEALLRYADGLTFEAWKKAGLVESTARIQLEIQFLEDVLID